MATETRIKTIIEDVLKEMGVHKGAPGAAPAKGGEGQKPPLDVPPPKPEEQLLVPEPTNREAYRKAMQATAARVGIWRTGSRYLTAPSLRFRADHAVAQDAVFSDVSAAFLEEWGLLEVKTRCEDKDQFLTRPDLGRQLDSENTERLRKHCPGKARVQVYVSDGLSSTAVEENAKDTYQALVQGLKGHGVEVGTPFFLRFGRVPAMDAIAEILHPEVIVVLIGERPGLATAESMSCYIAYQAKVGMPEARRTVLSNIHQGGTPAVEAGAHIADVVKTMLDRKASGLELKKESGGQSE